jgi:hypothetical protein
LPLETYFHTRPTAFLHIDWPAVIYQEMNPKCIKPDENFAKDFLLPSRTAAVQTLSDEHKAIDLSK